MRYYESEENSNKIPYDKEPIYRQTSYKKQKNNNSKSGVSSLLLCVIIIINVLLGVLVIKGVGGEKKGVENTVININSQANVDVSAVSSRAKLSVVCVHAGFTTASTDNPNFKGFYNMSSKGAGVIFKDNKVQGEAYIVTCFHVVKGYTGQIYVLLYDSFIPQKASLVYYSSIYDVAVIKLTASQEYSNSHSEPARIADSSMLIEGDGAIAVGNPLGTGISVTSGIISKTIDLVDVDGITQRVFRIDAAINNGNSGGGLFNYNGEFIGLVSAKATDNTSHGSYIDCVAYAIPSNVAISIANNILRNKMPIKAVLGVTFLVHSSGIDFDVVDGKYIPVQAVIVSETESDSLFEINDKVVGFSYGDKVVNMINLYSFDDHAFNISKDEVVKFFIERDGKSATINVRIKEVVSADYQDWYGSQNN